MVDHRTDDPRDWEDTDDRTGSTAAGEHEALTQPHDADADRAADRVETHPGPHGATASEQAEVVEAPAEPDEVVEPAEVVEAPAEPDAVAAEHERLVAERQARREARLAALAPAAAPGSDAHDPQRWGPATQGHGAQRTPEVRTETVTVTRRSTDRFPGALGLFLLRLVTAAIMGVHGLNKLLNLPATTEMLQNTVLPSPGIMAIVIGAAEVAIAIALVFGLLTRVAGLGVALVSGGALAFVLWGPWSPFQPGQPGLVGELELLLVAVGLLLLLVGGGGWSVDRGFRARRDNDPARP